MKVKMFMQVLLVVVVGKVGPAHLGVVLEEERGGWSWGESAPEGLPAVPPQEGAGRKPVQGGRRWAEAACRPDPDWSEGDEGVEPAVALVGRKQASLWSQFR